MTIAKPMPPLAASSLTAIDNLAAEERLSLLEVLDRVLNTGVVIVGDLTISVAGIDLVYLSVRALLTSVETARSLDADSFAAPARVLANALNAGSESLRHGTSTESSDSNRVTSNSRVSPASAW